MVEIINPTGGTYMKKGISLLALLSMFAFAQGAFAWTYDGLGSLNPFTNFGRGFGRGCGCEKPKVSNCNRGKVRMTYGCPTGFAAPVVVKHIYIQELIPVIQQAPPCPCTKQIPKNTCNNCHRRY